MLGLKIGHAHSGIGNVGVEDRSCSLRNGKC